MIFPKGTHASPSRGWRRKPVVRLESYILRILRSSRGVWVACPGYAKLAGYLGYAVSTISAAFAELENDPLCPVDFASDFDGPRRTRRKMAVLKSWLDKGPPGHDRQPLHWRADGSARGTRASFRKGAEPFSVPANPCQTTQKNPDETAGGNFDLPGLPNREKTTSADKQEPASAGLSGCILEGMSRLNYYMLLPADYDVSLIPDPASPNALAWRYAKAAQQDGELFYDNRKPVMPVASLRALLLPAFERGMSWERQIRPALLWALQQAHDAACLSRVRNPGGFAAVIFRERLGLRSTRRRRPGRSQTPDTAPRKIKDVPVCAPPVKPPPRPAVSVDRTAVRAQARMLAAMMREALAEAR